MNDLKQKLESIYLQYNNKKFVNPDPLLFLYNYPEKKNREIAGLIAASFAYGRVDMIIKTVKKILDKLVPCPFDYLMTITKQDLIKDFKGFKYRFAREEHLVNLLWGMKQVINHFSSLENCFSSQYSLSHETIMPCLIFLYENISKNGDTGHLLADPKKKSPCKRSNLFLRWMVRKDSVDPGGWNKINASQLIIPLDTHMYKIGKLLKFTKRKSKDIKTALEITKGFKQISPLDPVKYDFCLTRFGIRQDLTMEELNKKVTK